MPLASSRFVVRPDDVACSRKTSWRWRWSCEGKEVSSETVVLGGKSICTGILVSEKLSYTEGGGSPVWGMQADISVVDQLTSPELTLVSESRA